jgi:hypothetical protein
VASPHDNHFLRKHEKEIRTLQCTAAFYNYEKPAPSWRLYVNDSPVEALPARAKPRDVIAIHDGVTYIGVVPLPAADLGGAGEVVLAEGGEQEFQKKKYRAALVIDNMNLSRDEPLGEGADWKRIDRAYGGFVIEFADASEYATFEEFRGHMREAKAHCRWEPEGSTFHVRYASGRDVLETGVKTTYKNEGPSVALFAYRRVNGVFPYLPEGVHRETPTSAQSTTGRIEKAGAVVLCEKGTMAYLRTEPVSGTYAGYKPFPDPADWSMRTPGRGRAPGGVAVTSDGRLGMVRAVVRPKEGRAWIDHAFRPGEEAPARASAILVSGLGRAPRIEFNGRRLERLRRRGGAVVIPLAGADSSPR